MTSSSDNILLKEKEGFSPQTLEKLSVVAKNSYGLKNPPIGNSESYNCCLLYTSPSPRDS